MDNNAIADVFDEVADILEIEEVEWKPRAYRNAALGIRNYSKPLSEVYKKDGIKGLKEIPGIGENIAKKIEEIILTGKLSYLEKIRREIPKVIVELMALQHVGPKTAKKIYDKFKIKSMEDLKKLIKQGKLHELKGFGEKLEHEILEGIEDKEKKGKRYMLNEALPLAEEIKNEIMRQKGVSKALVAGSIARMKENIGDIDILVEARKSEPIMDYVAKMKIVEKVLSKGETRSSIVLKNGIQVDVRIVPKESFGSATQYFVGSKEHNVRMRQIAIKKGLKLSEYGLFKGGKAIAGAKEEEIYRKLGMEWIPFEMREERGEIEAAQKGKLPKLVELKDIKGDLHCHSTYSDGRATIAQLVKSAEEMGYEYIAIADHSEYNKIGEGISEKIRREENKEIDKANKNSNIRIIKGIEADIKKDGTIDMSKEMANEVDIVIASVHIGSDEKDATKRTLMAMDNPAVNIIAHPTGRIFEEGKEGTMDFEMISDKAKERGIILEINANPYRFDLNDVNAYAAMKKGIKMVIDTDAHDLSELECMKYGVGIARRAWCEKKDIINTMPWNKIEKIIRR